MANTQIRGGSSSAASQIKDASVYDLQLNGGITTAKLAEGTLFVKKDGTVVFTADQPHGTSDTVSASNFRITKLADPTQPQDAATRAWVLSQVAGGPTTSTTAKAASTANLTLTNTQTVDGIALNVGDVCLVKNQTTPAQNGLYTVASGGWTRTSQMDIWTEVPGILVTVQQGTVNADTMWLSTADAGGTLNTTPITFVQMPGPSDVIAGAGLLRTGQQIDVVAADGSMQINTDSINVKLDPNKAIEINAGTGLGVKLETTNPTLQITSNQLGAKLDPASATGNIQATATGINVKTNNSLVTSGNTMRVDGGVVMLKQDYVIRDPTLQTPNGAITAFTLTNALVSGTEQVFLNGVLQEPGAGNDYTIATNVITFLTAPITTDRVRVSYMKGPSILAPN